MLLCEWIEASSRAVGARYPQFAVVKPPLGSGSIQAWEGIIQPFPSDQKLGAILQDLENAAEIIIRVCGGLVHDPNCTVLHANPAYLDRLSKIDCKFKLLVLVFPPKRHPEAMSLEPLISRKLYPTHPHLRGEAFLCPYFPSDGDWSWENNNVADFLDYTSIWLAKHMVWDQTGGYKGGTWIGYYAGHTPRELVANVGRNLQCPCGRGRKYKRCCRPEHVLWIRKQNRE